MEAVATARLVVVVLSAFAYGNDATMSDFTLDVFELDRSVDHLEIMMQHFFHIAQDPFADRGRDIGDGYVAGERSTLGTNAPYMEVVDVVHPFNLADRRFQTFELESAGSAFEQDVHGLAQNAE